MKLRRFDYSQFEDQPTEWKTVDCTFGDINLIVGRNATGKTKTLNVIRALAELFSEADELKWGEGKFDVEFQDDDSKVLYALEYTNRKIVNEQLIIDGTTFLSRGADGTGVIYFKQLKQEVEFQTSDNRAAVFAKRDSIQHPFLDRLFQWGQGLLRFDFGTPLGRMEIEIRQQPDQDGDLNLDSDSKGIQGVIEKFRIGKRDYGTPFVDAIIADMARIEYELEEIGLAASPEVSVKIQNIPASHEMFYVKESDLNANTFQLHISQGMFRAFSVLIQINYSLLTNEPSCILIDDIGEGLDFARSSALVNLIIEKVKGTATQLIMTTNDRFIMNSVPLEYWIILERRGGQTIHHNYRNSKEMFEDFELTGLSNFDLFSSNYYLRNGDDL